MALVVHCPNPACKVRLTFGDNRAGSEFCCPKCDSPVRVPAAIPAHRPHAPRAVPPPPAPRPADPSPTPADSVLGPDRRSINYWPFAVALLAFAVAALLSPRVAGAGWAALGLFVLTLALWWEADRDPPGEAEVLARSRGSPTGLRCYDCGRLIGEGELVRRTVQVGCSYIPSDGDPKHQGRVAGHYGRVDLCGHCDWLRDESDRKGCSFLLVGACLVVVGLFCRSAALKDRGGRPETGPPPTEKASAPASPPKLGTILIDRETGASVSSPDGVTAEDLKRAVEKLKRERGEP